MDFRNLLLLCIAIIVLASCTSAPVHKKQVKNTLPAVEKTIELKNSRYYINKANQDYLANNNLYERNELLVKAAEAFQIEQECEKAIKTLWILQPELRDNRQLTLSNVIMAECYLKLSDNYVDNAEELVQKIDFQYGYEKRISSIHTKIYSLKEQWIEASSSLLKASRETTELTAAQTSHQIWQWLNNLDLDDVEKNRLRKPALLPWLTLTAIVKRYALETEQFREQLYRWQRKYAEHPLAENLPDEVNRALNIESIDAKRVAILLPLTGRLGNQGLALKQGILAAYLNNIPASELTVIGDIKGTSVQRHKEIQFFDSALKTAEELNTLVSDFDLVVGPLMKEKISDLSAILPADKVMLALNRIDSPLFPLAAIDDNSSNIEHSIQHKEHYYFSLAPEDEAEQLAQHIYENRLIRPIVFAAENKSTKRMAEAFINQWKQYPNVIPPEVTVFKDNKDMGDRVSKMLDVAQSKSRIRQIEYIADVEVFGVERNRRDIDAIVLFANPEQTELLNPIIEANLSPFARKSLSVFASSRSYSANLNSNNLRDLRNLTFSDMPWMLPDHKWNELTEQTEILWPQKRDVLLRLFAMGVDAYNLLPKLRKLKALPKNSEQGLTGEISIDAQGRLHRRLKWAQIIQDRVTLLAMD